MSNDPYLIDMDGWRSMKDVFIWARVIITVSLPEHKISTLLFYIFLISWLWIILMINNSEIQIKMKEFIKYGNQLQHIMPFYSILIKTSLTNKQKPIHWFKSWHAHVYTMQNIELLMRKKSSLEFLLHFTHSSFSHK